MTIGVKISRTDNAPYSLDVLTREGDKLTRHAVLMGGDSIENLYVWPGHEIVLREIEPVECAAGELEQQQAVNWSHVPADIRDRCMVLLRERLPHDMIAGFADQHRRNVRIGSEDLSFHHGAGMWIRNLLRLVISDAELPAVAYEGGTTARNWDDFYMGALQQLALEHALASGGPVPAGALLFLGLAPFISILGSRNVQLGHGNRQDVRG